MPARHLKPICIETIYVNPIRNPRQAIQKPRHSIEESLPAIRGSLKGDSGFWKSVTSRTAEAPGEDATWLWRLRAGCRDVERSNVAEKPKEKMMPRKDPGTQDGKKGVKRGTDRGRLTSQAAEERSDWGRERGIVSVQLRH